MLAARDQENLAHGHHAAAAAKPLNQSVRGLAPKTPGNKAPKTPFKIPLNDENATIRFGAKTNGKGNENVMTAAKKGGFNNTDAFVTPMGPRTRAPLGQKTTNAKALAVPFQTPAPPVPTNQKSHQKSASARRPRPRHSVVETAKIEPLADGPLHEEEIEYMPPKPIELPDHPEDFPPDREYPQFKNGNMTRGWYGTYLDPLDDDGKTGFERREEALNKRADEALDRELERMLDEMPLYGINVPEYPGAETIMEANAKREAEEQQRKAGAAIKAVAARPAVSSSRRLPLVTRGKAPAVQPKTIRHVATATKPTVSFPSRKPSVPVVARKGPSPTESYRTSPMRQAVATAASRTTIGYSKGRVASGAVRPTVMQKMISSNVPPSSEAPMGGQSMESAKWMMTYKGAPPLYTTEEWERLNRESSVEREVAALEGLVLADPKGKEDEREGDDDEEVYEI
jgi:hypothetical protein